MKNNSPTLHLMIIWNNAESFKDYIFEDIERNFAIYKVFKVFWDKELFSRNLSIFYSHSLKEFPLEKAQRIINNKLNNIGSGYFYTIVFEDQHPNYQGRKTTSGNRMVNSNVFDKKAAFRAMTGGGSLIHCSDDSWETNKDLTILFGCNIEDFKVKYPNHSTEIEEYKGNCKGVLGYKNEAELFYVLNNTVNYCLLSNHSIPSLKNNTNTKNGIVLLVDNKVYATRLTGAKLIYTDETFPYYYITIEGQDILVVFRHIGDNYYDELWEKEIIENRIIENDYKFEPDALNRYYSFLYHIYVHNKIIDSKLYITASKFAEKNRSKFAPTLMSNLSVIFTFLKEHGYKYVRPNDNMVYYNIRNIDIVGFEKNAHEVKGITNLTQVKEDYNSLSDFLYFKGDISERKVFIKFGGVGESCSNEYVMTKRVYECSPMHFIEPIGLGDYNGLKYIIYEWVDGISIDKYLNEHQEVIDIKNQLIEIYEVLQKAKVMHRDIRPDNLLVVGSTLKLIDFQFAIDNTVRKELSFISHDLTLISHIGNRKFRFNKYGWKDSASIINVLNYYGLDTLNIKLTPDKAFYMTLSFQVRLFFLEFKTKFKGKIYSIK